jgi:hypothetical protein
LGIDGCNKLTEVVKKSLINKVRLAEKKNGTTKKVAKK